MEPIVLVGSTNHGTNKRVRVRFWTVKPSPSTFTGVPGTILGYRCGTMMDVFGVMITIANNIAHLPGVLAKNVIDLWKPEILVSTKSPFSYKLKHLLRIQL